MCLIYVVGTIVRNALLTLPVVSTLGFLQSELSPSPQVPQLVPRSAHEFRLLSFQNIHKQVSLCMATACSFICASN